MDEDLISNWPLRLLVEVKGPLKEFPCTDPGVEKGLQEEIEGKFSLWDQQIPKVRGIGGINTSQDSQEVALECANDVFCLVVAMHVGRD
jgi:hypothetical protein